MSTRSERHAAYACGLGMFGLIEGPISVVGKAIRTGSPAAQIRIEFTPGPYSDQHADCLIFTWRVCGKCIFRRPAGAITKTGHDKVKCKAYRRQVFRTHIKSHNGFEGSRLWAEPVHGLVRV